MTHAKQLMKPLSTLTLTALALLSLSACGGLGVSDSAALDALRPHVNELNVALVEGTSDDAVLAGANLIAVFDAVDGLVARPF